MVDYKTISKCKYCDDYIERKDLVVENGIPFHKKCLQLCKDQESNPAITPVNG